MALGNGIPQLDRVARAARAASDKGGADRKPSGSGPWPAHVAMIMAGNEHWARAQGLDPTAGWQCGAANIFVLVDLAVKWQIPYLSLFDADAACGNSKAQKLLITRVFDTGLQALHDKRVAVRMIGDRRSLSPGELGRILAAERLTATNDQLRLSLAVNYDGRSEIVRAARRLAQQLTCGEQNARPHKGQTLNETQLSDNLDTGGMPDPDLVILTGGRQHLGNRLLWQSAYAEFAFFEVDWPDFGRREFQQALADFQQRDRRFGGRPAKSSA